MLWLYTEMMAVKEPSTTISSTISEKSVTVWGIVLLSNELPLLSRSAENCVKFQYFSTSLKRLSSIGVRVHFQTLDNSIQRISM